MAALPSPHFLEADREVSLLLSPPSTHFSRSVASVRLYFLLLVVSPQ